MQNVATLAVNIDITLALNMGIIFWSVFPGPCYCTQSVFTVGCLDIGIQRVPLNLACLRISSFVAQPQILTVLIDNYSAICPVTPWSTLAWHQFTFDDSQTMFLYSTNWLVCWHVHLWNSPGLQWYCYGCLGVYISPIRVIQKEQIIVGAFHSQLPLGLWL